jgi:hypothetical protein
MAVVAYGTGYSAAVVMDRKQRRDRGEVGIRYIVPKNRPSVTYFFQLSPALKVFRTSQNSTFNKKSSLQHTSILEGVGHFIAKP